MSELETLKKYGTVPLFVDGKINEIVYNTLKTGKTFQDEEGNYHFNIFNQFCFSLGKVFGKNLLVSGGESSSTYVDIFLNYAEPIRKDATNHLVTISKAQYGMEDIEYNLSVRFSLKSDVFYAVAKERHISLGFIHISYGRHLLTHYQKKINFYVKRNALPKNQVTNFANLVEAQAQNFTPQKDSTKQAYGIHYLARLIKHKMSSEHALWFAVNGVPGNLVPIYHEVPLEWVKALL